MYNFYILFHLEFLCAFRSNKSIKFCSLLDSSFKFFRYLCNCTMFNCGTLKKFLLQAHNPNSNKKCIEKKNNYDNINEGTIKYCNPIKSVWKTDETFVLIFGTFSLLNSHFYGMRNPFHSLSSEIVKNRPFALRGHVISFSWKWKLYDFAFEKTISGSYLEQNNSDLVFQTRTIFLKWVSS